MIKEHKMNEETFQGLMDTASQHLQAEGFNCYQDGHWLNVSKGAESLKLSVIDKESGLISIMVISTIHVDGFRAVSREGLTVICNMANINSAFCRTYVDKRVVYSQILTVIPTIEDIAQYISTWFNAFDEIKINFERQVDKLKRDFPRPKRNCIERWIYRLQANI